MAKVSAKYIVIRCPDCRFHAAYQTVYDEFRLGEGGYDLLAWPGVSLPLCKGDIFVLLNIIKTLIKLHGNTVIFLLDHDDCGAYGEEGVADQKEEHDLHRKNLRKAEEFIKKNCPTILEVKKLLVFIDGRFEEVE